MNQEKQQNRLETLKRTIFAFLGLCLCGIGVGFFIQAGLGVDPPSVLTSGIAYQTSLSYGNALLMLQIVLMTIVYILDKSYLHIASFLSVFVIGYVVDFTIFFLGVILGTTELLSLRFLYLFIGLFILAWGIPVYIQAGVGVSPVDCLAEIISEKRKIPYKWVRMCSDALFLISGIIVGGSFGIATVIVVLFLGPSISLTRPLVINHLYKPLGLAKQTTN